MSKFDILIVEPNIVQAKEMKIALEVMWGYKVIETVSRIDEVKKVIETNTVDLILLNTHLENNESGFDLMKIIKRKKGKIPIILIADDDNASIWQKARTLHPNAYLIKPFVPLVLQATVELTLKHLNHSKKKLIASGDSSLAAKGQQKLQTSETEVVTIKKSLFIKQNKQLNKIKLSTIQMIESSGNYCYIHTTTKKYIIKRSLQKIKTQLPQDLFIQIHKSFLVQLSFISSIDTSKNLIYLEEKAIPLGRKFKEKLFTQLDFL